MSSFKTILSFCVLVSTISSCLNGANQRPRLRRQFEVRGHIRNIHNNAFAGPRNAADPRVAAADRFVQQEAEHQLQRARVQQFNIAAEHAYADVFADQQHPTDRPILELSSRLQTVTLDDEHLDGPYLNNTAQR